MRLSNLHTHLGPSVRLYHPSPGKAVGDGGDPQLFRGCFDSRRVVDGDLFCAINGSNLSGDTFVGDAERNGAGAVLCAAAIPNCALPQLIVPAKELPSLAAQAASFLAGSPSADLRNLAVTGTNGKTTVVYLLSHALEELAKNCARVGTIGMEYKDNVVAIPNTTPAADLLHPWLSHVKQAGGEYLAIEASSHGLHQQRLAGIPLHVVAWTNLSHDHLDYHRDLTSYAAAKAIAVHSLVDGGIALLPKRGAATDLIHAQCATAKANCLTWSIVDQSADIFAKVTANKAGVTLDIGGAFGDSSISSNLIGEHNAENLLLTWAILCAEGFNPSEAAQALKGAETAPGRLQRIAPKSPWNIYVDYAHTPDALQRVLQALRQSHPKSKIGVVFGAGGDRDQAKREPMGRIAAEYSDWCVVTSDNPRTENPAAIVEQVAAGAINANKAQVLVEVDRACSIRRALAELEIDDVLLVAGKGHENYQEVNGERSFFDDRVELEEAIKCMV